MGRDRISFTISSVRGNFGTKGKSPVTAGCRVIRFRIVNTRFDVALLQELLQVIAPLAANDVHVVNGLCPLAFRWRWDQALEPFIVTSGNFAPVIVEAVQVLEHYAANRGVDLVKRTL